MKIRVWHILVSFCLLLIMIRFALLYKTITLFFYWVSGLISGSQQSLAADTADYFISAFLVIVIPAAAYLGREKLTFLKYRVNIPAALLIILFLAAVMAPLASSINPEFQKNISVTRLLPPMTKKYFVQPAENKASDFNEMRSQLFDNLYSERVQIADSVNDKFYFQGNEKLADSTEFQSASHIYILGTDELGRDIFSRLIYGTRISLTVGLFSVLLSVTVGVLLGFFAGYYEGWPGSALNRAADIFLSFPSLFLVILIIALFGNSIISVIIVLGFTGWMPLFKIIRGEVKALKSRDFFVSASMLGLNKRTLILKEMMPVVIAPVVSSLILLFGNVIVAEASLSYLGLGTGIMFPSWGSMIEQGQSYMRSAWWMILFPGIFLFAAIISANSIGKKIEIFFNPRIK